MSKTIQSEKDLQRLKNIEQQSDNIEKLLQNMITLAVFDSNQTLPAMRFDLNQILQNIHKSKQSVFNTKGLECKLELDQKPFWVLGEMTYFDCAIRHIVDNAIQHTPQNGNITIRTQLRGKNGIVDIIDTGDGISEAEIPRIFERFYRVDKTGSTRGFGLGLPTAKVIIERYQGNLQVETALGKGSTFRISLPSESSTM